MNKRIIWTTAILALIATAWGIAQDTPGLAGPISADLLGTNSNGKAIAITLGTNLSLAGTTLNASGGGSTQTFLYPGFVTGGGSPTVAGGWISASAASNSGDLLFNGIDLTQSSGTAYLFHDLIGWGGGSVSLRIWAGLEVASTGSGTWTTNIKTACVANNGTLTLAAVTGALNAAQTMSFNVTGIEKVNVQTISSLTMTGCSAGNILYIQVAPVGGGTAVDKMLVIYGTLTR